MKKFLMLAAISLTSPAFAAAVLTAGPSSTAVTTTTCVALNEDVKINLSKSNVGTVDCAGSSIGAAVANIAGKAKVYSSNSAGGAITEAACAGTACIAGDATTAAGTALTAAQAS